MSDVFITYAPADHSRVQGLSKALKRRGWSICAPMGLATDTKNRFGPNSKVMLVLCSPYAANNPSVLGQIRRARVRNIPIVPIIMNQHAELPATLDDGGKAIRFDWDPPKIYQKLDTFLRKRSGTNFHEVQSTTQTQTADRQAVRPTGNQPESITLRSTAEESSKSFLMVSGILLVLLPLLIFFFFFDQLSLVLSLPLALMLLAGGYLVYSALEDTD